MPKCSEPNNKFDDQANRRRGAMRWPLSAMLLTITIAAFSFGTFTAFWVPSQANHQVLLGAFILLVSVSTVAAVFGNPPMKFAFFGASLFGILYLIFVLHGGFGLETMPEAEWLARNTKLGFALIGISFLASQLSIMVAWPSSQAKSTRQDAEQLHTRKHTNGQHSIEKSSPNNQ